VAFSPDDTIVAIATPPGRGGIGVVRVSGAAAVEVARAIRRSDDELTPRHATFSRIRAAHALADQAIVTWFPAPHSYTGEHVVEISAHGSPMLLGEIVKAAIDAGARLAEPGEFTFRAYLRGRLDLVQAEAVRDLVDAVTPLQARAAFDQLEGTLTSEIQRIDQRLFDLTVRLEASLDFPEEGYHFLEATSASAVIRSIADDVAALLASSRRGRLVREGMQVVIAGRPNAGKSSLFNCLAGAGRAIVTERPGTTRDLLTETVDVSGIPVTLVDTAGLNAAAEDPVEIEGIARAIAARDVASVILLVLDASRPLTDDDRRLVQDTASRPRVVVASKSDLPAAWASEPVPLVPVVRASAITQEGLDDVRAALVEALTQQDAPRDVPSVTNIRHAALLDSARAALLRAAEAVEVRTPEEFVLADLTEARARLEEVTGRRTPDDVLAAIFQNFCIGK
jgi:tRNA modification GTPase